MTEEDDESSRKAGVNILLQNEMIMENSCFEQKITEIIRKMTI